jgi:hypothetical protein
MSRIVRGGVVAVLAIAFIPAGAALAASSPTTTLPKLPVKPKPTLVTPTTPVKPGRSTLNLSLVGAFHVNNQPVTITERALRVNGVMRPFIPGQIVTVHAFNGNRLIHSQRVRVARSPGGTYGSFSVRFSVAHPGSISVSAVHAATATLARTVARATFSALNPSASFGSTGRFVQLIQSRLWILHFFIQESGVYDGGTGNAILAYRKLRGWARTQDLDRAVVNGLLDEVGSFQVRFPHDGHHAEANLGQQLVAFINGSNVQWIVPTSSGKPDTPTVLGHFSVYDKSPGYNAKAMYYSNYFTGGYAIHGYDPVPEYAASHGCLRIPIADAIPVFNWLGYGDAVDVYY